MGKLTSVDSWFGRVGLVNSAVAKKTNKKKNKFATRDEKNSYKSTNIGVLSFEVASLMSKTAHLWHSLEDEQISRLKHEIFRVEGVEKLVSSDESFLLTLALSEIIDSLQFIARSVARLGAKCTDPVLQRFEHVFADVIKNDTDLYGLTYAGKKMERKVKKMERLVAASSGLYHELEVLAELEQTLRRMKIQASNSDTNHCRHFGLVEFKHKVVWQRQEVDSLRDNSVWNRTYDYVVRLLARSLFNIVDRIKLVFGYRCIGNDCVNYEDELRDDNSRIISRCQSMGGALFADTNHDLLPLPLPHQLRNWKKKKTRWSVSTKSFNGCIAADAAASPVITSCRMPLHKMDSIILQGNSNMFNCNKNIFQHKAMKPQPSTLGASALALRYANVIILIEKLAVSPNLIGNDARDDLYNMLTANITAALRARLKSYAKNLNSTFYDPILASEWNEALTRILGWLAPLAHNMIRWQSERNFDQQNNLGSSTNVLLLQTLYFANQAKTEAAITELLVGLNYLWRFGRERDERAMQECVNSTQLMSV